MRGFSSLCSLVLPIPCYGRDFPLSFLFCCFFLGLGGSSRVSDLPSECSFANPPPSSCQNEEKRNLSLGGHVGFDSLPDQLVSKSVTQGFSFNILCVGEHGSLQTGVGRAAGVVGLAPGFHLCPGVPWILAVTLSNSEMSSSLKKCFMFSELELSGA